jgi:hypothetical protein
MARTKPFIHITRLKETVMHTFRLSSIVQAAAHVAMDSIQQRYGDGASQDNKLAFHGPAHTNGVLRRAVTLAQAMGATEAEADLAGIAAAFHDTVQNWEENRRPDGAILRKRFAGRNEQDSATEAVRWMQELGNNDVQDAQLVTEAILATVPGWDPANGTVCQPNLKPDSHLVVRAVALADLATAGMQGTDFAHEGDPLFREEQLDIARTISAATRRSDIPVDTQEGFRTRMLQWSKSQAGFANGRKARLEAELGDINAEAKDRVKALFCGFDAAIDAATTIVTERSKLSFWEIADAMGYTIPLA